MLMGFVPQELINHGYFDIEEIMQFHSGYFGRRKNQERIEWLLRKLSLWEHRKKKVKQLSGGMKRRLLIAKSLVHEPKLLLLDEPTAGVDLELRSSLWTFVDELRQGGMSILLTTHYIQEAEELCDRVGILQGGQIRCMGETKELIKELTKREIIVRLKPVTKAPVGTLSATGPQAYEKHPYFLKQEGDDILFQVPSSMGAGDLLDGLGIDLRAVADLIIREGSLEDALRRVLGEGAEKR
jgi:ABC-2 type transport system ATP-binding protein